MNFIICWGAYTAVVIRVIIALLLIWQIIPLGIKEATVKNGLRQLRFQLLVVQIGLLAADLIALWLIFETLEKVKETISTPIIQIISALFLLVPVVALYLVYHNQYTPESREVHRQVDIAEKKRS